MIEYVKCLNFLQKTVANILRLSYNKIIKKVNHQTKRSEKMKVIMYGRYYEYTRQYREFKKEMEERDKKIKHLF